METFYRHCIVDWKKHDQVTTSKGEPIRLKWTVGIFYWNIIIYFQHCVKFRFPSSFVSAELSILRPEKCRSLYQPSGLTQTFYIAVIKWKHHWLTFPNLLIDIPSLAIANVDKVSHFSFAVDLVYFVLSAATENKSLQASNFSERRNQEENHLTETPTIILVFGDQRLQMKVKLFIIPMRTQKTVSINYSETTISFCTGNA